MSTLSTLIQEYREHLEIERGRSVKTVENYGRYLARFLDWLAKHLKKAQETVELPDVSEERIRKYRLWLNRYETPHGQSLSTATQNYHMIAFRNFLTYLAKRELSAPSPDRIDLAKQPDRQVTFLESDEVERLLRVPEGRGLHVLRDRAILETLFSTGLRVSELCALNVHSVNLEKGEFAVRGKGGKVRVVFLSESTKEVLGAYLEARSQVVEEALFVRIPRGKKSRAIHSRLIPRSIQRLLQKYAAQAGIVGKRVTPHTLRHSMATDLLRNGADIRSVQALLGHASITTTQVYTHVTDPHLREIHERFHRRDHRPPAPTRTEQGE